MPDTDLVLYQPEDGPLAVQVTLRDGNVWLDRARMAELFQRDRSVIQRHITAIFESGELDPDSVCAKNAQTGPDGKTYDVMVYNLDVIMHVGYRVGGHRGAQFRTWATDKLHDYVVKGFAIDDARLAGEQTNYFDELVERVRRIRTSERNFTRRFSISSRPASTTTRRPRTRRSSSRRFRTSSTTRSLGTPLLS